MTRKFYIRRLLIILICGLAASIGFAGKKRSPQLQVLIVTGQNNHNWKVSHQAISQILENSGRFKVEIARTPEKGGI